MKTSQSFVNSCNLLHLEEHGEVPDLVGQLVAEDGEAGAEAAHVAVSEGGSDGETVRQVVDPVPADNHDGHAGDGAGGGVGVAVEVGVAAVHHLVLGDDHRVPGNNIVDTCY